MAGQNNGFIPYGRFKLQTGQHEALIRRTLQHEALGQKNNSFRTSIWFEKSLKLTRTHMLGPNLFCCYHMLPEYIFLISTLTHASGRVHGITALCCGRFVG